jgi:hypothetical protein
VEFSVFAVTILICMIFIWLYLMTLTNLKEEQKKDISIIECQSDLCLCYPNSYLTHDTLVSFYHSINNYEKLIGYGYVVNIQNNGIIQIKPLNMSPINDISSFITLLTKHRKDIIIKTTITFETLNYISNNIKEGN